MDSPVSVAGRLRAAAWPVAVAALLVLAVLFLAHRYRSQPNAFDSDNLYAVEVSEDLLGRGYELANYHLPYAPYLFPDLLLMVPVVALFKGVFAIFLVYNLLYYGMLVLTLTALFRQTGLRLRAAFVLAACGPLALLAAHLGAPYAERMFLLYHPTNHAGAILVGLFLALLVVRDLHRRTGWPARVAFVVAGGLGLFSDRLLLPQFLAPLCGTVAVLAAARVVPVRKALGTLALTGAAGALAAGVHYVFAHCGFVLLPLNVIMDADTIGQAWHKFREGLPRWVEAQYVLQAVFVAFVPIAALAALRSLGLAREAAAQGAVGADRGRGAVTAALALIGLLSCACTLAAVVVSGLARYDGAERYLLAAVFIPFLFLGVCARSLPVRPLRRLGRACPAAFVLFACLQLGVRHRQAFSLAELRTPYPEAAQVLDRLAGEKKISHGLATFWNARRLHYLTRQHVEVRPMLQDGVPWLHSHNPNAFLAPGRGALELPHYDFILFNEHDPVHPTDRAHFLRHFGSPREVVPAGAFEVWLYDGLLSNELNLFLRTPLAARCRGAAPYVGPTKPLGLAQPKSNLAPKEARGTVVLPPDGEVRLTFAAPVTAEVIDFGASYDAHFDVLFYRGDELLATLYAPRVQVEGTFAPYCPPGNQSRLLAAPAALRGRAFTSAVVRAKGGPGCFALGHFLVYPKAPPGLKMRQAAPGGCWVYEAESQPTQVPGPAAVVADTAAGAGHARFAPREFSGYMVYGPYAFLDRGRYRIDFFVRAGAGAPEGKLARVEVVSAGGGKEHAARDLTAADLAGGGYQKFSLAVDADVELSDCEFRVFSYAKAPLYVDRVELVCEE